MTEEEAKLCWCPFVRFTSTPSDDFVPNRSEKSTDSTRCIASACMAWRWETETYEQRHTSMPGKRRSATVGFCGLAGPLS